MNKISQKAVAFLLLLTYILLLMPTFSVSAASATKYTLPTVSLAWKDGEIPSASDRQVSAVLELNGNAQGDVKVHVKTFDISATGGLDYTAIDLTITLNAEKTTFTIGTSISLNQGDVSVAVKDGDNAYTELFGITIVSVTNAFPDPENNTLIAGIGYADSAEIVKKNGSYIFMGADSVKQSGVLVLDDTLTTEKTTITEDFEVPFSNGFKQHMIDLWRDEKLNAFYNIGDLLYFNGGFTVTCSYSAAHGETFELETGCGTRSYYVDVDNKTSKTHSFNFFGSNSGNEADVSSITISARNQNTVFAKAADGVCLKFYFGSASMTKTFSNLAYYTTLVDLNAPEITEYRLVNLSAYEGGNVYIAVDFSEPVQLTENSLRLNVSIGGTDYSLKCIGGTFTKTLLFAFEDDFDGSFFASGDLKIKGFNKTTGVCDLLWNAENENNVSVLPTSADVNLGTVDIDTRTPKLSNGTCATENKKEQSHSVSVELSQMTTSGKLYYAWSTSSDAYSVSDWIEKTNFVIGTNVFTHQNVNGDYYLHVKAEGANGASAYWTYGPLTFYYDAIPPRAESITCDTAANSLPSHTLYVVMNEADFDDLKYAHMYVIAESGDALVNGRTVYGSENRSDDILSFNGLKGTITLSYKTIGMPVNTSAKYKIGFVFEDTHGNKTAEDQILYSPLVLFDSHGEFEVDVVEDPVTEIETVKGYEVLVSGEGKSYEFEFKLDNPYSAGDRFGVTRIIHNGKEIFELDEDYSGTDPYTDGFGKNDGKTFGIESIQYNPESQSITVKVNENAKGYYEFSFFYNEKTATDFPVYFTTENDMPNNFYSISEEGLLTNRVWTFANKRFYRFEVSGNEATEMLSYEITSNRYAESGAAPAFSDKDKAYEYALFMELQDVALVYLGPNSTSIVNLLNSGMSAHFKKAIGETATAATGQTWIRYKNTVWDTSQTPNAQDYAYYYYSNQQETSLDYDQVMSLLIGDALKQHAKSISNYDNGEWLYLTANTGEVDGNGEPKYQKDAVFDEDLTYQGSFSKEITYKGDTEIYSTTISNIHGYSEIDEAYLLANYTFTSDSGRTVLFYREYNGRGNVGEYTEVIVEKGRSVKLRDLVSKTGVYEFIEFDGNGSRKFFVYADFYAPTLRYEYTQSGKTQSGYLDRFVSGSTIRAGSVTLLEFVTTAGGYTPEYDEHAYLYVTSTSGKVIAFMTAKELKASGGLKLTEDTVIVYLYDRLGNFASITIRANESDLYATATVKDDEALILTVNRSADEIAIGGFKLYKDSVLMDIEYSSTLTLYESGKYTIELADIYGNTYSETFEFQRSLPVVEFQCKDENGDYVPMGSDVNGSAYVVSLGNNAYQVTASSEIRLKYDADAEYEFTVIFGNPTLKHTRSGSQYVRIIDNSSAWTIKIAHKKDPSTYIIVTCAQDKTPPDVFAKAITQEYTWNEQNGIANVLFAEKSAVTIPVENGQTLNCRHVTITWDDANEIRNVTITRDGKVIPLTQGQLLLRSMTVSGFGKYTVTVTDILNNSTSMTFNIASDIGLSYYIDGEKTEYSENPLSLIYDGEFADTQYTSKDIKLVLTEYATVAFLYQNEAGSGIYQIQYHAEGLELYYLNGRSYKLLQTVNAAAGELFANVTHDFVINYEIKDGKLTLMFPKPTDGFEFWQIRVTDLENTSPVIIQFERSNRATVVRFVEKETGELIETNTQNEEVYTGAKSAVTIYEPSITEAVVKISVYYSEKETFDFYRKTENILFGEGQNISEMKDEGYYKIVTEDVYGNTQIVFLRIGFGFEAVVKIFYDNLETVEYTVDKSGSFTAKSNHSVQFTIWAEKDTCTVTAQKDGVAFTPDAKASKRYFTFTVSEVGEYKILVDDGCGNVLTFTVSLKAPTEITYNNYLTGFNEEAPYRDKMYTNGKVNVDYARFVSDDIRYIYYRVTQNGETSVKHILYNLLIPNPAEYKEEDFLGCIGKEGNGAYEIVFADEYGNSVTRTVRISDGGQITVSRLTESSATPELLAMEQVLAKGAWSNRSVIIGDSGEAAVLKVDGEKVSIVDGEYILTFPPAFAEGYETHEIDYMDEYGNKYRFTVHLQKRVIEAFLLDGVEMISVGDERFVKGSFGYTWTDPQISARYSLGSMTTVYEKDQLLSENGKYVLTFFDFAGNSTSKTIIVDTAVSYKIIIGHNRVPNGIATNEIITISGDGETLKVVSVKKDGEILETSDLVFRDHGVYEIELADVIGNTSKVEFAIFTHAITSLDYTVLPGFAISGVWLVDGADRLSYVSQISTDETGAQKVSLNQSGAYDIELKDLLSGTVYGFGVSIDHTPPDVTLEGVDHGGTTRNDVTIMGLLKGDHVDVYRGQELVYSKTATKDVDNPPFISEPGNYRIVVSDEAGNTVEYEFTREFTSNAASNIIILMLLSLVGASGFIFLIVSSKAKVK